MPKLALIDLSRQYASLQSEIEEAVLGVLRGGRYILGPEVKAFEEELAAYCGVGHAIGVANGTDALTITMKAMGIGEGDEVITTPLTFYATAETIAQVGAKPVFVDVDAGTYNIDPDLIEAAVTERTKAIMPVHLFGLTAAMNRIREIAGRHGLKVIEDACQAIGAEHDGRKTGGLGDAACYSFFPTKNLSGYGDGGAVVTDDAGLAEMVRMLRFHGSKDKVTFDHVGFNSRLDEVQAAVIRVKMKKIDEWNELRRQRSALYREELAGLPLRFQEPRKCSKPIYHLFIVEAEDRDGLGAYLNENGFSAAPYYKVPMHMQPVFSGLGYSAGDFPVCEGIASRILALPLFPEITEDEVRAVAGAVRSFLND